MGLLYRAARPTAALSARARARPRRHRARCCASGARLPGGGALLEALFRIARRAWCRASRARVPQPGRTGRRLRQDRPPLSPAGAHGIRRRSSAARSPRCPRPGNPRPRLFRLARRGGAGQPHGLQQPRRRARRARSSRRSDRPVPRGVSIGKSRDTPLAEAARDHRRSLELLAPHADYVALNVSSPNTPGLRGLEESEAARRPARRRPRGDRRAPCRSARRRSSSSSRRTSSDAALDGAVGAALAAGAAGLILTNTTLRKEGVPEARGLDGGLSGRAAAPARDRGRPPRLPGERRTAGDHRRGRRLLRRRRAREAARRRVAGPGLHRLRLPRAGSAARDQSLPRPLAARASGSSSRRWSARRSAMTVTDPLDARGGRARYRRPRGVRALVRVSSARASARSRWVSRPSCAGDPRRSPRPARHGRARLPRPQAPRHSRHGRRRGGRGARSRRRLPDRARRGRPADAARRR